MKAAEKNRQKLSSSEMRATNSKYKSNKNWKINLAAIEEYIEYMTDDD